MRKPQHRIRQFCLTLLGLVGIFGSRYAFPDEPQTTFSVEEKPQSRPSLHTPAEIYKIMEDSKLVYEIGSDKDLPQPPPLEPAKGLSDQAWLVEKEGGGLSLTTFALSTQANQKLAEAEKAFAAKDYDLALKGYEEIRTLQPDYHHLLTLIGDVYYNKGGYETAKSYYEEAIRRNFADYQAHWFLADALWKLGDKKMAVEQVTIAHLLNVGHAGVKKALHSYREKDSHPWKDWQFSPRFSLERDGKKIKINAGIEWLGYACVKAVWEYEPGYAESMAGPDYKNSVVVMVEEKEALVAYLSQEHPLPIVSTILDEGFLNEFIYYEMIAPKAPTAMVLFPRESFMRIVQYIDKYH